MAVAHPASEVNRRIASTGIREVQTADCAGVDLNAIAKGFIVDLASDAARRSRDQTNLMINAGGDIGHRGATAVGVGIEDLTSPLDNAPPLPDRS